MLSTDVQVCQVCGREFDDFVDAVENGDCCGPFESDTRVNSKMDLFVGLLKYQIRMVPEILTISLVVVIGGMMVLGNGEISGVDDMITRVVGAVLVFCAMVTARTCGKNK